MSCAGIMQPGKSIVGLLLLLNACFYSAQLAAQHSHGVLSPSVTFPQDDSVLRDAPRMITMSFRVDVRLLKLALYTDDGQWINLGFAYDPGRVDHNFVLPIPLELPDANYFVAEWSVVDEQQRFLQGNFKFSFGAGALPPSEIIEASYGSTENENLPDTGAYVQQNP